MYDAVRARLDVDDLDGAVAEALAHWRRGRDPAVAAALQGLTDRALKTRKPRAGRTREEFHTSWLEVAADADAVQVGWLAKTLLDRIPEKRDRYGLLRPNWTAERLGPFMDRLRAISRYTPDPRVARALLDVIRRGYLTTWYDTAQLIPLYQPVLDTLVAAGDPHLATEAEALAAAPIARQEVVRVVISTVLPAAVPRLRAISWTPETYPAPWLALAPAVRQAPDVSELLTAVYEDPSDDEPRAVLADVLAEAGDPRGEFVQLQLALASGIDGADAEKMRKAAGSLLRQHKTAWLGDDLDSVLVKVEIERGWLHSAELAQNAVAPPEVWARAPADDRLRTLSVLRQGRGNREHYTAFVTGLATTGLTRSEVPTADFVEAIASGPVRPRLAVLEWARKPKVALLKRVGESKALPALRGFRIPGAADLAPLLKDLQKSGWIERLQVLELQGDWRRDVPLPAVVAAAMAARERLPALNEVLVGDTTRWIEVHRGEDGGWFARTHSRYAQYGAGDLAAALPPDVERLS